MEEQRLNCTVTYLQELRANGTITLRRQETLLIIKSDDIVDHDIQTLSPVGTVA